MPGGPFFIGSDIYRRSHYGAKHPLAIPRVSTVIDLSRALGWLPDAAYIESPQATPAELERFHAPDYIAALRRAEAEQRVDDAIAARYNIGRNGNPIFSEMFRRPATGCGASILAARMLRDGGIVYSPAGGTHHGRPDRASGFCYFNDPVLAILNMLDGGLGRVVYLDVDAHHGDGVEAAFVGDRRVLAISVHEEGRWPGTGSADEKAQGSARNYPVPAGFNDAELAFLLTHSIEPLARRFAPDAVVLQCGADGLADDPMSRLALSNNALWRAVRLAMTLAPRLLVLGGGGYNPWSVARCWVGVWATLNGLAIPERLPPAGEAVLRQLRWHWRRPDPRPEHWFTTLADPPTEGGVRPAIRRLVDSSLVMA